MFLTSPSLPPFTPSPLTNFAFSNLLFKDFVSYFISNVVGKCCFFQHSHYGCPMHAPSNFLSDCNGIPQPTISPTELLPTLYPTLSVRLVRLHVVCFRCFDFLFLTFIILLQFTANFQPYTSTTDEKSYSLAHSLSYSVTNKLSNALGTFCIHSFTLCL